jgi:hypothetical protein
MEGITIPTMIKKIPKLMNRKKKGEEMDGELLRKKRSVGWRSLEWKYVRVGCKIPRLMIRKKWEEKDGELLRKKRSFG